jgi:gliding motility-associated-like protein
MRGIYIFISLFYFLLPVVAQNYNMSNTTVTTCGGNFNDSGGPGGQYSNNENYTMTFCPIDPEDKIRIEFTGFNIQLNADYMYVYDGPNTSAPLFGQFTGVGLNRSPGIVQASPDNTSGCVTFVFQSDGSTTQPGWQSTISCYTPCQDIVAILNSTNPSAQADGVIRICQGQSVTFNGSATFSKNGTGATYLWDLDNGITAPGTSVTRAFNTPGVFLVNLIVTDNKGCKNDNKINQVVHVSTTPRFTGTIPSASTLCLGQTATIPGVVAPTLFQYDCTPPVSGITFLPDGNGVSYFTSIAVDCFNSDVTITNGNTQIQSVCVNMEHSYLGDLSIVLRCPTGQIVPFINYSTNSGGGTILGRPVAWGLPVDDNSSNTTPGVGFTYCFSPFATGANNFIDNAASWDYLATYVDPIGNVSTGINQVRPGTYRAVGNWNNFNGCPLNGNWTIRVTDNLGQDNGYIFWWGMTLAPGIVPSEYSFTPVITNQSWDPSPSIVNSTGNNITVQPTTTGSHCYTYRVTDNFNCSYDTTVCVTVNPGPFAGVSSTLTTCSTGPSVNLFSLLGSGVSTTGTWSGPSALGGGHLGTLNPASAAAGTYTYSVSGSPPCTLSTATVVVSIGSALPVSVSVAAYASTVCAGTSVTFTATPTNGGATPIYQWYLNNNPVGVNSPTYTSSTLVTGDQIRVTLTNNEACATGSPANSNTITMTVNPSVAASVSISSSANPVCAGTNVTFTATPANGGAAPVYQWLLNGNPVGSNSATYSNATLTNGDQLRVQLTSNTACVTGSPTLSNTVNMTINPAAPASVSISTSANPICSGTSVTFTATPTNGGSTPVYQWLLNGNPVGSNSTTYTNASLANGDQVRVQLTSNAACATGSPALSAIVTMTVNTTVTSSVSISPSANPVCAGTAVTFTATPTNGGASPAFQWLLNGNPVGSNNPTYTNAALANSDQVSVQMTSNANCVTGSPATSNTVNMSVNPSLPVSVSIAVDQNPICSGTNVTFTATPTNGGASPTYQWLLNGNPVGSNSATFSSSTLNNADQVRVQLTSNAACLTGNPALSNTVNMQVNTVLPVSVSIVESANAICIGTPVTFTATPVNGGASPAYQWLLNGNPVGSNSPTYNNSTLANGDQVSVLLTSSSNCASGSPATSNTVTMTANPDLPASVSIAASGNGICQGTSVTFTATPTNGGSIPSYQWLLNSNPVGGNSNTYSSSTLANGDQVSVVMTSNATTCVVGSPATSNTVNMSVSTPQTVSVSIAVDQNPICSGTNVTFTATPTNGGASPTYQWLLNGNPVGSNSATFSSSTLNNADQVRVQLTSNAACLTGNPALSNTVNMQVNTVLPVSVSIVESANAICIGTPVTFTATPVNGGASPAYQWLLNGNPVGSNSSTYNNSTLANGDQVSVLLTSSSNCASGSPANSNLVTMVVFPYPQPELGSDKALCTGTSTILDPGIIADSYSWSTGETTPSIEVSDDGNYSVNVTKDGCSTTDNIAISFILPGPASFSLGSDTTICESKTLSISVPIETGTTFTWQDGSLGSSYSVSAEGSYYVIASNTCGSFADTIEVIFDPCIMCEVYLPNAFTPNRDGVNDRFVPLSNCENLEAYRFRVFNRWNELVFESDQPGVGWDGTYKGKVQPLDVFIFYVSFFDSTSGQTIESKGIVNLLR